MIRRTLLSFVFVTLVGGFGIAQSSTRYIQLRLTMPNGGSPTITVREGETATAEVPDSFKFGFVPTVKSGDSETVVVDVLDLHQTPATKVDTVETSLRGRPVMTNTNPQIGVHVTDIVTR